MIRIDRASSSVLQTYGLILKPAIHDPMETRCGLSSPCPSSFHFGESGRSCFSEWPYESMAAWKWSNQNARNWTDRVIRRGNPQVFGVGRFCSSFSALLHCFLSCFLGRRRLAQGRLHLPLVCCSVPIGASRKAESDQLCRRSVSYTAYRQSSHYVIIVINEPGLIEHHESPHRVTPKFRIR